MPELVKAGYVYKALPPLYVSRDPVLKQMNFNNFISDKKEYISMFNQIVAKSVDMLLPEEKGSDKYVKLSNKEKIKWLNINKDYLDEMVKIIKRCGFDYNEKYMYILERIIETLMLVMGNSKTGWNKKFKTEIEKVFPEMTYSIHDESLEGSYEGIHITLIVDKLFIKLVSDIIDMLHNNVDLYIQMKPIKGQTSDFEEYTIGTALMKLNSRYSIRIDSRFKGLSEINAELMFNTVTNPLFRKLVRLTTNDMNKAEKIAYLLHSRKNAEDRRILLDNMKISYDDIDN
jgi:DNA gyrase/topoisomerase IV subunit B